MTVQRVNVILFVEDQRRSAAFYARVLDVEPSVDVPGMTELPLGEGVVLGLMPERGIRRLTGGQVDPSPGQPRSEVYLLVDDPAAYLARALKAGARELSPLMARDWGEEAAYCLDLDGHLLAFARRLG